VTVEYKKQGGAVVPVQYASQPPSHPLTDTHCFCTHQVTVEYKKQGGAVVPVRVHTILISTH
jgi:hypothetical protein